MRKNVSISLSTEQEFAKNVMKAAEGAKSNVGQQVQPCFVFLDMYQGKVFSAPYFAPFSRIDRRFMVVLQEMMPLQYIYTMALEQDIKNSVTSRKTSELLHNRCYQVWKSTHKHIQKVWVILFVFVFFLAMTLCLIWYLCPTGSVCQKKWDWQVAKRV